jgi:type II secretory pathway pseudopilin PulG
MKILRLSSFRSVPRRRGSVLGTTFVELIITTGIFSILVLVLFVVLRFGIRSWKNIESKNAVQTQLSKVELFMLEDLKRASYDQISVLGMPSTWAPGKGKTLIGKEVSASAVWFLTAFAPDKDTGELVFTRDDDGKPVWKRNILYYVTRPTDKWHKDKYGFLCASSGNSKDTWCPHKWLIRKEIDVSTLLSESTVENTYLTKPGGHYLMDPTLMGSEPDLLKAQTLADSIVDFEVILRSPEVEINLRALRLLEAQGVMQLGTSPLENDSFTVHYRARVVPNN